MGKPIRETVPSAGVRILPLSFELMGDPETLIQEEFSHLIFPPELRRVHENCGCLSW